MRKLNKDRVFRHMARDVSDHKVVYLDRDYLLLNNEYPESFVNLLERWRRLIDIKYKNRSDVEIKTFDEIDLDLNRAKLTMLARPRGGS